MTTSPSTLGIVLCSLPIVLVGPLLHLHGQPPYLYPAGFHR